MNKEEVLAKSRSENKDEGLDAAEKKGNVIGITAFCLVFIFITFVNLFDGQSNYAPRAMFWTFFAVRAYPQYRFTHKKAYLLQVVAGAIAALASLASFVLEIVR